MMGTDGFIWLECFVTGIVPREACDLEVCAMALSGWALCMAGSKPPEKFGEAMVVIGQRLNILPLAENVSKLADKPMAEREEASDA